MKIIAPHSHRALDYSTVAVFALAPFVLGFGGAPAYLSITLAAVHLVLTLLTRFDAGGQPPVPLTLHGLIELVVGITLVVLPMLMGWMGTTRMFFMVMGVVILAVWLVTQYRLEEPPA